MEMLIVFLFGFPGAFLSLLVSTVGIVKNKYWLVLIGALLFFPFTYYLDGSPAFFSGFVFLLPLLQFGSALSVFKNIRALAWLLLAPSIVMVLWILGVVLIYSYGSTGGVV